MATAKKKVESFNYNRTLTEWRGGFQRPAVGDQEVGIEIEVEGASLPDRDFKGWRTINDGSLRGESHEYIFDGPASRADTTARLAFFAKKLRDFDATVQQSYRTSVHVHLNAQNLPIRQIYTWMLLYIMFEDVLAEIAGKDRIGNLFCLRAKDAEYFFELMLMAIRNDNLNHMNTEQIRYSAVNPMALFAHGTLEFRSFRGTVDTALIQQWVDLLLAIKDAAVQVFDVPTRLVQDFSSRGPVDFAQMIFKPGQIALFPNGWEDKIMEGARLIQRVAFSSDWGPTPVGDAKKTEIKYAKYMTLGNTAGVGMGNPFRDAVLTDDIQPARLRPIPMPRWNDDDDVDPPRHNEEEL